MNIKTTLHQVGQAKHTQQPNWVNNNLNHVIQILDKQTNKLICSPRTSRCMQKKNKSLGWKGATGEGRKGRSAGRENGSACSFYFPLFHRGAPIDRSSAQIHQQMFKLAVSLRSWPPLTLSASSPHPFSLFPKLLSVSPHKPLQRSETKTNMRSMCWQITKNRWRYETHVGNII